MVRLIKQSEKQPVTAAIGDGANDVSMIQEADVGLGELFLCLVVVVVVVVVVVLLPLMTRGKGFDYCHHRI